MYHSFYFPLEQKWFPVHKVKEQPQALVTYEASGDIVKVQDITFNFGIFTKIGNRYQLADEIEAAANTHYTDMQISPEGPKEKLNTVNETYYL